MTGRRHDPETILAALELLDAGRSQKSVARKLDVSDTTVKNWRVKRDADPSMSWLPRVYVVDGASHGTLTGYSWHDCRCRPCRDAYSAYERGRAKDRILRAGPRLVPACGVHRRLSGLYWMGWPAKEVAARAGVSYKALSNVARASKVRRGLHDRIAAVYDELHMVPGPSAWTRARAKQHGHMPPLVWDEDTIDDPAAKPDRSALRRKPRPNRRR